MGSSKKSRKAKLQVRTEGHDTKVARAEELKALFDQAAAPVIVEEPTKTSTRTSMTPTPTPTVPTGVSSSGVTNSGITQTRARPVVSSAATAVTRPSIPTVISKQAYTPAKRIDYRGREETNDQETPWWLGPALILGAVALLAIGWFHIQQLGIVQKPVGHPTTALDSFSRDAKQKIDFYRAQLGHRLNRDRVNVEILNSRVAPSLETNLATRPDRSMMTGVPLMQENYVEQNFGPGTKTEPVHIDYPDARIQYGLQEEQHREEFDRRVEREYAREFVENARRDGVHVVLDKDGNVIRAEPIGSSNSGRSPGSGFNPGVAR